ncbi:MAG: hypothetical protein FJX57_23275 [Alphaproteobacteria bacterium]|nr:hypothetical protein [Alphaproteobacteria bacterium]
MAEGLGRRSLCRGALAAGVVSGRAAAEPVRLRVESAGLPFVSLALGDVAVDALVDTGSTRLLQVSMRHARAAGLTPQSTGRRTRRHDGAERAIFEVRFARIAVAGRQLFDHPVDVIEGDIEGIGARIGVTFDAILGWSFLSQTPFAIDGRAAAQALDLAIGALPADGRLALQTPRHAPIVVARLRDESVRLLLDSGAPRSAVHRDRLEPGRSVDMPFELGAIAGTHRFRGRDLGVVRDGLAVDGILGWDFFSGRRLSFDRANARMTIT